MPTQVVHFEIPADDTAQGREFWGALFGWQFQAFPGPFEYHMTRVSEQTTYRVTLSAGAVADLQTPLQTFDGGLKMLISESPTDHGSDSRRVYVPGIGFVVIATPLALVGGTSQEYRLQKIKNVADAGTLCGF